MIMKTKYIELNNENLITSSFEDRGLEGKVIINESLNEFKNKKIFPWNLLITFTHFKSNLKSLPVKGDYLKIMRYREALEKVFNKGKRPNVLFVANICIGNECDLIWRVHDAEYVNRILKKEIDDKSYEFEFGYRMNYDVNWLDVVHLVHL